MSHFFYKTQNEMNHLLETKHTVSVLGTKTKCLICEINFASFYCLQKHESEHGKISQIQDLNVDLDRFMGDRYDEELRQELTACQHILVKSEFVKDRQHVFNFASTSVTPSFLKDKLQQIFGKIH